MFNNKNILITGGTGSFGQKFVQTILQKYSPSRLIVYSRDELKQYEMAHKYNANCMRYFLGDVRDVVRLDEAMRDVDFVIHAAAIKHVGAAEYNPMECIKTNIYGAENVIKACLNHNVQKVIALSTDKAVSPNNLYGATKLASDKLFVAANNMVGKRHTMFSVVRYGNVVGSRGSIVPLFQKLIAQNATHLPITDEKMTRFLITLHQGVESVLSSFARMHGGEIFIPKIPSMKIVDLAKAMSNLPHEIVGIRPGEKRNESLCSQNDSHLTIEFGDHYVIEPSIQFSHIADFETNALGEKGVRVGEDFEYHSGSNTQWIDKEMLLSMIDSD